MNFEQRRQFKNELWKTEAVREWSLCSHRFIILPAKSRSRKKKPKFIRIYCLKHQKRMDASEVPQNRSWLFYVNHHLLATATDKLKMWNWPWGHGERTNCWMSNFKVLHFIWRLESHADEAAINWPSKQQNCYHTWAKRAGQKPQA